MPETLTGPASNFGQSDQIAFKMAVDAINKAGGIKTQGSATARPLELDYVDDQNKTSQAITVADKMLTLDKDIAILGGDTSATCQVIAKEAQQNKTPYLMHICLADSITQQGWDYVFRVPPPLSKGMDAFENFLDSVVHPKSLDVVAENSVYGQGVTEDFKAWAKKSGVTFNAQSYNPGSVDDRQILTKVKDLNPDVIVFGAYLADAITLTKQSAELGLKPKLFAGTAGFTYPQWLSAVSESSAANLYTPSQGAAADANYPGTKDFYSAYDAKAGHVATYSQAFAYASVFVLKDALSRTKLTGNLSADRAALQQALKQTDLMTIVGPVKFVDADGYTNQTQLPTVLLQVQKDASTGKLGWVTVWPSNVSSAKYVFPVPGLQQ